MRAIRTVLIGIIASTVVFLAASGAGANEAKELWDKNCASCHGADGKAQTKTGRMLKVEDLTNPEVRAKFDRARMIQATKDGIPKEEGSTKLMMPAYAEKLTDEQIGLLIDYVESFGNE